MELKEIGEGRIFQGNKFSVTSRWVEHYNKWGIPSLGYRVDSEDGSVAISGDTNYCQAMVDLANNVDVLIHECTFPDEIIKQRDMKSHSGPTTAGKVAQEAGAKKLILTHLGPYTSQEKAVEMASMYYYHWIGPEIWSKLVRDVAKHYDGPILLGQDAMTVEIQPAQK